MNLAFFGGSFNPPHIGHENIIKICQEKFDNLLVIPNNVSPFKTHKPPISKFHRLNMIKLIIKNLNVKIDTFEFESTKKNYTYHTIQYLKKKYIFDDLFMIIGIDQLKNFNKWYRINDILKDVKIICFNRDNIYQNEDIGEKIEYIPFDFPVSSSEIREMISNKLTINEKLVNKDVVKYISENNLYVNNTSFWS